MKLFKTLIAVFVLGIMFSSCATRTHVRVTPRKNVVVTKIQNPHTVVHKNVTYYYAGGQWYHKKARGYVVVKPLKGLVVNTLPKGYKVVTIKKNKYYTYKGVYYKKTGRKFVVVRA